MKVLITGGAGYVGSALTNHLISEGHDVKVFDKGYFGFEHLNKKAELVIGDIRKPPKDLMENIDAVIHLAAFSNDPTADYDPKANWTMNFEGTKAIVDLAKGKIKRFIEASTCSMYYKTGERPEKIFTEEEKLDCKAPYPKSKWAAEDYLMKEIPTATSLRKGTIFGQSPKMRYDLVLNTFVKDAFLKGEIKLHAGGQLERPILSLEGALNAYQSVLEAGSTVEGEIFNVVDHNIKIIDLAFIVYKTLLEKRNTSTKLDIWRYNEGIIRSYNVSGEKFNSFFPERKKQEIEDAILEVWDKLIVTRNPEDPEYYNIYNLEELKRYEDKLKTIKSVL